MVLIFLCGALSGSLGTRWMQRIDVSADSATTAGTAQDRKGAVKWFTKGLDLNPKQLEQLNKILEETRTAYTVYELEIESIKQHARARIREILTEPQKAKFDQLLAERASKEAEKERHSAR
ncbi:MAG: hypothetical protein HY651_06450 [Acidobacteria bacterium]|nr:hypothetical protein [Acidobacteriota bacterium]